MTAAEFHKSCFRAAFNLLNEWRSEFEQGIPDEVRWTKCRDETIQCEKQFRSDPLICALLMACNDELDRLEQEGGGVPISRAYGKDRAPNHAQKIAGL